MADQITFPVSQLFVIGGAIVTATTAVAGWSWHLSRRSSELLAQLADHARTLYGDEKHSEKGLVCRVKELEDERPRPRR